MAQEEENKVADLTARLDKLEATVNKFDETLKEVSNKMDTHEGVINALNAERESEKAKIVEQIVEKELLTEEDAKATPLNSLKALLNTASKGTPTPAPGINGAFKNEGENVSLAEEWEH